MGKAALVLGFAGLLSILGVRLAWAQDVDVAVALVSDVSRSIDDQEYQLEKDGYVRALGDKRFLDTIQSGSIGKVAVAYIEFAGESQTKVVLSWTVIQDSESARAFAEQLVASPRSFSGRTAIGAGISLALQLMEESDLKATRRVIDVCGDGTNNAGPDVSDERDKAVRLGVVINGLAIINEKANWAHTQPPGGLARYYRENVTGGQNSFVLEVRDFATISQAMIHKLLSEIATRADTHDFASRD